MLSTFLQINVLNILWINITYTGSTKINKWQSYIHAYIFLYLFFPLFCNLIASVCFSVNPSGKVWNKHRIFMISVPICSLNILNDFCLILPSHGAFITKLYYSMSHRKAHSPMCSVRWFQFIYFKYLNKCTCNILTKYWHNCCTQNPARAL